MPPPTPLIWAYTYRLVPPQPAERLKSVRALLDREHAVAGQRDGTWEGRLVVDERISHILVLSDSPDLELEANRKLEAQLRSLDADYVLTVPMPLVDQLPEPAAADPADLPPTD